MLTYDSGNVQDLKPFVADNGEVYWAKENGNMQNQEVHTALPLAQVMFVFGLVVAVVIMVETINY